MGTDTNAGFTKLFHDVADSEAWKSLSRQGQIAYINLLYAYRGKAKFSCPRNKLKIYMSPRRFTAGIKELEGKGFITVKRFRPLSKIPNAYTFIKRWRRWE